MTILPGETPCLRRLMPEPPAAGEAPTCETAGILGPAVAAIAARSAGSDQDSQRPRRSINRSLTVIDLWENRLRQIDLAKLARTRPIARRAGGGSFPGSPAVEPNRSAVLCGRGAVQLTP